MRREAILMTIGLAISGLPAMAASIEAIEGDVSINRGDGFKPASGAEIVSPSDRVMVGAGGSAIVIYSEKCRIALREGEALVIRSEAPCTQVSENRDGSFDVSKASFLGMQIPTQAAGDAVLPGAGAGSAGAAGGAAAAGAGLGATAAIVGGVVLVGGVATAIVVSNKDEKPASP